MLAGRNGARGRMCFPSIAIQVSQTRLVATATCNRTGTGDALDVVSLGGRLLRLGLRKQMKWSLLPVLPRRDFLTKEACRLPQGG